MSNGCHVDRLETVFIQPFPENFGFDTNLVPTDEFRYFTQSNEIYIVLQMIREITGNSDTLYNFLDLINIPNNTMCLDDVFFFAVDVFDLAQFKARELGLSPDEILNMWESGDEDDYIDQLYKSMAEQTIPLNCRFSFLISAEDNPIISNMKEIVNKNIENITRLQNCLSKPHINIMRLNIMFVYMKHNYPIIKYREGEKLIVHASQLILNIIDKKGYIFDSDYKNDSKYGGILKDIKDTSLEIFLKHYIDENFILSRADLDACPNLQGTAPLCAVWSLYLFLLYLLNPEYDRNQIYRILREYSQKERDLFILQFMFYIRTFDLKSIILPELFTAFSNNIYKRDARMPMI